MARVTPPYFFQEYLRPIRRKEPTPRERALGLTVKDLEWLHTLYYATDEARQDAISREAPMRVETLTLEITGKLPLPLAGVFLMSPSPDEQKALLYTPDGGIEVFKSRAEAWETVTNNLKNNHQHNDLISFLSINQRKTLALDSPFTLTAATIPGAVFEAQEHAITAAQQHNVHAMLAALRTTPTLGWMLDTLLAIMARSYFPHLDQRDTRVNSFIASPQSHSSTTPRWTDSALLSDVLLQFYLKQAWPTGQTRTYTHPKRTAQTLTVAEQAEDQQRWDSLVEQTAGVLSKLLGSLLQTWWNEDTQAGQSRHELFAQVMRDTFRADVLIKQQNGIVSAEESRRLQAAFLRDPPASSTRRTPLQIDKVRLFTPYQHYVELAATVVFKDNERAYLYTQTRGLQVLKGPDDLNDTLLSMLKAAGHEDELLNYLSLDERSLYLAMEDVHISGSPVTGNVFMGMVEDIIAKQLANMEHALGLYRRSEGAVDLAALLDCSLDIRSMLDSRLLSLDAQGRWSLHPVNSDNGQPSTVQAERAKQLLQPLRAAQAVLMEQQRAQPTLRSLARRALNAEMHKRALTVDADDVYINTYTTDAEPREDREPVRSSSLIDHFIARLAGVGTPINDSPHSGFYGQRHDGIATRWFALSSSTFNTLIDNALPLFVNHDVRALPRRFLNNHRDPLVSALMLGLRSEAELRRLNKTLPAPHQAILDTVLRPDSMPRVQRHGLLGFLPDAYGLTLTAGDEALPVALANCFVLTERGGIDPNHSGHAVLWTPQRGHEPFASVLTLREALQQRLTAPDKRLALLANLPLTRRAPHQAFHLGPLQRIDEHFLDNRQRSELDNRLDAIDYWRAAPMSPVRSQEFLDHEMRRTWPCNLDRAAAIAQAMIHQQSLPVWLGMAPPQEQVRHAELVEQYRLSTLDERDYLHGLPPLREHVTQRLRTLLDARFPGLGLNPEDVLIPARVALDGPAQSLTDFALRHLPDLLADSIRPCARDTKPLPPSLDGTAVVQLIRQLDIAKTYRALLTTHLTSDTDDTRERRALFCRQLPWQLLRHAHEEKLEERMSATAWGFVQHVIDMPDAVARALVSTATAVMRPLALVVTPGAQPVTVLGMYLISRAPPMSGPLVLYAPHSPLRVFTEFAGEAQLLDDINRPGPLQEWIIHQLDASHQATYRNLLRPSPPTGQADIRLATNPVRGNVLTRLFHDNALQLIKMLAGQFDLDGGHAWGSITQLLRKGAIGALHFIAGKLSYPWVVWRSFKLFLGSAEALQQQRFGEGLHAFALGLATLASLRNGLDESFAPEPDPAPPAQAFAADITDPARTRMRHFEAGTVALSDLQQSPQSYVYSQSASNRHYVPMAGKVFPVSRAGERWRVGLAPELGPFVERNALGQWVLDLSGHDPRFGPALSRYMERLETRRAERESINVEAAGMPAIRALSPARAECIDRALNVATYYTVTCLRNLTLFARQPDPNSRTALFLTEMFGVLNVSPEQVAKIITCVEAIIQGLTEYTLTHPHSPRFVVGTANWTSPYTYAFMIPTDIERKLYLLEPFFSPQMNGYLPHLNLHFDLNDHARSATLIHEISHWVAQTEDIAYLDSMRPFPDLINRGTADGLRQYTALSHLRSTALSVLTPATMLFKALDEVSQRWVDLGRYGSVAARDKVLHLTGARTLDDARQIFMSDADRRINIILANADSLTYLITHLGRVLDPGA